MKPFRVRWQDIVKKPGDIASNGSATIHQIHTTTYHVTVNNHLLTPRTIEGVDLVLEEYRIVDEKWQKVELQEEKDKDVRRDCD